MGYLVFATRGEAEVRNRVAWTDALGRPKVPEDTTEFIFPFSKDGIGGEVALMVPEAYLYLLSGEEQARVVSELDPAIWPPPPLLPPGSL